VADDWFNLLSSVHRIVEEDRKSKAKRVKIAILDTGVDATHPTISAAIKEKRIAGFFPNSLDEESRSDSLDPLNDTNGHGTQGTGVLLKTAPHAKIYVARVASQDGVVIAEYIPKVITIFPL